MGKSFGGRLPDDLVHKVSNETELYAIEQSVRTLARIVPLRGHHVWVRTDNTAAMFYVNKGGGRSLALSKRTRPLWDCCARRQITLSAEHIPGVDNVWADGISRRRYSPADWRLRPSVFWKIMNKFRYQPTIDAFAEPSNALVPRFASRYPVPGSLGVSGLEMDYTRERAFCFPPPRLVGRLLSVLRTQEASALLIVPLNRGAYWWPSLQEGAVRQMELTARRVLQPRSGVTSSQDLRLQAILYCARSSRTAGTRVR